MSASSNVRAGRAYVEVTAESSKFQRSLSQAQAQLQAFGKTCTQIGKDLLLVAGAAAVPMALAVKSFAAFDDQMRLVRAVTQSTQKDFEALTATAQKLGRETSFTAQQVADGMTSLGRMGFSPQEIQNAIQPTLDLARATGTDLAEAADIAANSMRIFGIESSQMSSVADILTATANGSAETLTDLFEALKMAGPQARAAGEDIRDTAAACGVLANLGIKGSLAGTALRKSYSQFAKESVQNTLKDVGILTVDANGNLRKLADIMADIGKVMASMPTAEKIAFAEEIFDVRGSLAGLSLGGNVDELNAFMLKLRDVNGVARETSQQMDAGMGGSFRLLTSAVEGAMNAVGAAISQTLQPFVDKITVIITAMIEWIEANSGFVTGLAVTIATVAALGAIFVVLGAVAKGIAAGITVVKVAILGLTKAFAVLKIAMTFLIAHPAIAALAALALVVGGLIYALGGASQYTAELSSKMQELREKGDAMREVDQARMERLAQLADKQHLSNEEVAEAADLIGSLEGKYGNFGASLDEVNGKLTLAADSQKRLNEAMKQAQILEIEAEIAELDNNISELVKEQGSVMGSYANKFRDFYTGDWSRSQSVKDAKAIGDKADVELKKLQAAYARLEALKTSESGEAPKSEAEKGEETKRRVAKEKENQKVDKDKAEDAEKKAEEIEKRLRRERQTSLENEIEDINTLCDEYKALIKTMLDYESAQKNPDKEKIAELEKKLAHADKTTEERKQRVYERNKNELADEVRSIQEQFDSIGENAKKQRELQSNERKVKKAFEFSDAEGEKAINTLIQKYQKRMQEAQSKFDTELQQAQQNGTIDDKERSNLDKIQSDYSEAQSLLDKYSEQLIEAKTSTDRQVENSKQTTTGNFFAEAIQALGQTSAADRTATATESIAKSTKKTYDVLRKQNGLSLTFS